MTICVCDAETGDIAVGPLRGHAGSVYSVKFSRVAGALFLARMTVQSVSVMQRPEILLWYVCISSPCETQMKGASYRFEFGKPWSPRRCRPQTLPVCFTISRI